VSSVTHTFRLLRDWKILFLFK